MSKALGVIIAFIVLLVIVWLTWKYNPLNNLIGGKAQIQAGSTKILATVVKSEKDKQIGLSGKNSLKDTEGMLFIFDKPGYYPFWMKDMKFPLDIIYLNNDKVITIIKSAPKPENDTDLPQYNSTSEANRVLEINSGLSDKYSIKEGDTLKISL